MGKDFSADVLKVIDEVGASVVVVPDDLYEAASKDGRRVLPYAAVLPCDIPECDLIVVHKGLMHRLGHETLAIATLLCEVVHADEVFVCYGRGAVVARAAQLPRAENMMSHVPSVRNYLKSEPLFQRNSKELRSAILVSAYGVGNIGDDLVSLAAKKMLLDVGITDVTLAGTMVTYDAIREADLVAVGGGGLFYDHDLNNCGHYLYPIAEAARQGKPSVVLGVGVDRIKSEAGKLAYSRHLATARFVSVRDPIDKRYLVEVDSALESTFAGIDVAFYIADDLRRMGGEVPEINQKIALFCLPVMLPGLDMLAKPMVRELKNQGFEVVILLHSDDDREFSQQLAAEEGLKVIDAAAHGIASVARLYACSSLVVAGRYHSQILGVIFGKSVITADSHGTKTWKLMTTHIPSLGASRIDVSAFDIGRLPDLIRNARAPERAEVQRSIAMAHMMKDEMARSLFPE